MPSVRELKGRKFVIAHRGASAYYPENTLKAVRAALEMGADVVEVDVRVTSDGYPVVIHDETVDRTTNGTGAVSEMTLEEIRSLDAGEGEKVPLLSEVVEEVAGKAVLAVELKVREAVRLALDVVRGAGTLDATVFISFDAESLRLVKKLEPRALTGLIYMKPPGAILEAKEIGAFAVLPYYRLATEKAVKFAKRLGLVVVAWVVDDPDLAIELWKRGVDGIATNKPDVILHARDRLR